MRQLEIGPGRERIEGFETLNIVPTPATDHVGDARRTPFKADTFDLVYSSHCIEHMDWWDVESTIAEWARIVKPGGQLEVFTVNAYSILKAFVDYEETGVWSGPGIGTWRSEKVDYDPYKWAVGRLLNYPKRGPGGERNNHRALITPGYLWRCFEQAGLVDLEMLGNDDARGKKHGDFINFGIRGTKC